MINKTITISKEEILTKYSNLDSFFKAAINIIYGEESDLIDCVFFDNIEEQIIKAHCGKPDFKKGEYCKLKGKTGVYIFIEDLTPVYIGVAGICNEDDLVVRLNAETHLHLEYNGKKGWNNATLSKNIFEIDSLLFNRNDITAEYCFNKIKACKLKVLVVGDMTNINKKKSIALESVLIALFNTKYNK